MLASKNRHAFDRPVNRLDDPMLIVTAEANGDRAGCLGGEAGQCRHRPAPVPAHLWRRNHIAVLVEPVAAAVGRIGERLGFLDVQSFQLGHPL
jgi:hypothetical protein